MRRAPIREDSAERSITLLVRVSVPVTLAFDADDPDADNPDHVRQAALENFIDHPALKEPGDLAMYVDSIEAI